MLSRLLPFVDTVTCEKCGEEDRVKGGLEVPLGHSPPPTVLKGAVWHPEKAPLLPFFSVTWALTGIQVHTSWTTAGSLILLS